MSGCFYRRLIQPEERMPVAIVSGLAKPMLELPVELGALNMPIYRPGSLEKLSHVHVFHIGT